MYPGNEERGGFGVPLRPLRNFLANSAGKGFCFWVLLQRSKFLTAKGVKKFRNGRKTVPNFGVGQIPSPDCGVPGWTLPHGCVKIHDSP
jgi:hypothetical protein